MAGKLHFILYIFMAGISVQIVTDGVRGVEASHKTPTLLPLDTV